MSAENITENVTESFRRALEAVGLRKLSAELLRRASGVKPHGDAATWRRVIESLPVIDAASCDFDKPAVRIGEAGDCDSETSAQLRKGLLQLKPWRKGPFDIFGIAIDSEWQSNMKWQRLAGQIADLRGRRVLDVGCGNGYYLWRMLGQGATLALGIDPAQLFIAQFDALKNYCPDDMNCAAFILPLTCEQFPAAEFDSVFSMGVLSHRREPLAHLREMLTFARPGGELIIETLLVDGDAGHVFTPHGRYAKMRNVWAIPSALTLEKWLVQVGARDCRLVDVSTTTTAEQRATEWMDFESLADFLSPSNPAKTIEGHPAPQRGIFICRRAD